MAMGAIYLTDTSSGAPALSGTNGTLCSVLDWALVQKGWAIEYTATNNRVYRPGAGNRRRLFVSHDSTVSGAATLATIRGCEDATAAAAASIVNPFPTVTQLSNALSTAGIAAAAGATARPYRILLTDRFVAMLINTNASNVLGWDLWMFGDVAGAEATDTWATVCHVAANSQINTTFQRGLFAATAAGYIACKTYWCRSIDGSVLSTRGCCYTSGNASATTNNFGWVQGAPAPRAGYANRIDREKIAATCLGSSTTTPGPLAILKRGWIPNLWNPVHSNQGSMTTDDTFVDSSYNASAAFIYGGIADSGYSIILETTDTWSPPSG